MKTIAGTLLLVAAALCAPAGALVRGTTEAGGNFVSGGVGSDEIVTIDRERSSYPLSILTAATGSGAYLSDVHISITDQHQKAVLATVMDGPWLLVDLPPGSYTVEAVLGTKVKKTSVSLGVGGHEQATFYFDTHDQVEPGDAENHPPPGGH